jgi:hypothetical protein
MAGDLGELSRKTGLIIRPLDSGSTLSTRSSVVRAIRERKETRMISPMKKPAIFIPSGRSMTLTTVV